MKATPKDFCTVFPVGSVGRNHELENTAYNLMKIMAEKDNEWNPPTFEEYLKMYADQGTPMPDYYAKGKGKGEYLYVLPYIQSEQTARLFSPAWNGINARIETVNSHSIDQMLKQNKSTSLEAKLKAVVVSTWRKMGDGRGLVTRGKSYTGNKIADEIENETELGIEMMGMLLNLTIDLVNRDKINLPN